MTATIARPRDYVGLAAGVLAFYMGLTHVPAVLRGQGVGELTAVLGPAIMVLTVVVLLETVVFGKGLTRALADIGVTRFDAGGMPIVAAYLIPLVGFVLVASLLAGSSVGLRPEWPRALVSIVLINGLAEEVTMRGFVFRHLREGRSFWRAAAVSTVYFAAYHLPLIATQGPMVGLLATVFAVPIGLLTALAYEQGTNTIWAPALMHAATNGLAMLNTLPPAANALYLVVATCLSAGLLLSAHRRGFGRARPLGTELEAGGEHAMSEHAPRQVAMRWVAAYNEHDCDKATALYDGDVTNVQLPWRTPLRGREAVRTTYDTVFRAFPDIHVEVENVLEEGPWVVVEWRFRGTMRGSFAGHAPTGRTFAMRGCEAFRVVDGRIRDQHGYWDKATMFDQLGLA
ncbi:MAG: ester cyclase [Gemmatimonadales bacterium]